MRRELVGNVSAWVDFAQRRHDNGQYGNWWLNEGGTPVLVQVKPDLIRLVELAGALTGFICRPRTGDMANLGYSTINGDQIAAYGCNGGGWFPLEG